jgi:hypothetical protein
MLLEHPNNMKILRVSENNVIQLNGFATLQEKPIFETISGKKIIGSHEWQWKQFKTGIHAKIVTENSLVNR